MPDWTCVDLAAVRDQADELGLTLKRRPIEARDRWLVRDRCRRRGHTARPGARSRWSSARRRHSARAGDRLTPAPIHIRWRGKDVPVRHVDPRLTRDSPVIAALQSAMSFTTEVATLRLLMARERAYDVPVLDDGSEVRLRRRT